MNGLTQDEIRHIASEAAKEAVRELLEVMGVHSHDHDAIAEMQEDFAHLRAWRRSTQIIKNSGLKAAVTFMVTGGLGYLVFLFTYHK